MKAPPSTTTSRPYFLSLFIPPSNNTTARIAKVSPDTQVRRARDFFLSPSRDWTSFYVRCRKEKGAFCEIPISARIKSPQRKRRRRAPKLPPQPHFYIPPSPPPSNEAGFRGWKHCAHVPRGVGEKALHTKEPALKNSTCEISCILVDFALPHAPLAMGGGMKWRIW